MSKAKPPWKAAKKAEQSRRQRRKERLMLAGIILLMVASMIAYGCYLKFFYFNKPGFSPKLPSSGATSK